MVSLSLGTGPPRKSGLLRAMGLGLALELHVTLIQLAVLVDGVFSPSLSCSWALPGNMKKRLLMPSRGKAWGGRWWGAVAESCRDACVYCLLADWAVQGTYRGNPRRPSTETQATAHTSMLVM